VATLPATVALAVVTAVTAHSFGRVFAGGHLVPQLVVLALVVHGVAFGLRATRLTAWVAVPLTYLVALVVVARSHHADTLTAGWLPSTATVRAIGSDLEVVWREFPTALVPVPDNGPFAVLAALSVALVAATADLFGFRADGRVEALMPATVVFVALAGVTARDSRIGLAATWLFCALVALALLRAVHGERRTTVVGPSPQRAWTSRFGVAAGMAGVAAVAALAVAPRLPGAGDEALVDARRAGNEVTEVVSPLVDIRSRLVERSRRVLFHVSATAPAYWRLTSLARFNGTTWGLVDDDLDDTLGVLGAAAGSTLDQTFEIDALGGPLAPAAFTPTEVRGDDLAYVTETATLVATGDGLSNGMRYAVTSVVPTPTPDLLATATSASPPDPIYLELPDDFPNELRALAAGITAGSTGPYAQALALQSYFRAFDYTIDTPPGHSEDAMVAFIERRSGYCEQFAGTFAAFARVIGLPARVAVGFTPGGLDESGRFEVKGRNAHAWPEVWFDGIGWLSFEPTPGRGQPGADVYTNVPPAQATSDTGDAGGAGTTATTVARAPGAPTIPPGEVIPSGEPGATPQDVPVPRTTPAGGDGASVALWVMAALALVGTWALVMPPLVQWVVRRRRRRPAERVVGAWNAAATALGLVGAARRPSDTPIEHANRAARLTGFDPVTLRELAIGATTAVYSPRSVDASTASRCERLRRYVVTNAREFTPWSARVQARLDPRMAARLA
jgi:transglutaminase-like putative cysteine protease